MKTSIKYLIVISLLTISVGGCKKDGTTPDPVVLIRHNQPFQLQNHPQASEVNIKGVGN